MIDGTFDGKPSVITKGLQSFYPPKNFQGCPQKKRKYDGILSYLRYTEESRLYCQLNGFEEADFVLHIKSTCE